MTSQILNREFQHPADGFYMIEPAGEHAYAGGSLIEVIDPPAIQNIVNSFNSIANTPDFPGMLVDVEHFQHQPDKETRAYAWLTNLQARPDGIYAQLRWTNTGKAAVDGGDYRFFSTEYNPAEAEVISNNPLRIRPQKLAGLTLTNTPNNKGGKPITNRQDDFRPAASATGADIQNTTNKQNAMKKIAESLGLSAEASEDAILAEITKAKNRAAEFESKAAKLQNRCTELETEMTAHRATQADADLDKFASRIKPEARPHWKEQLLTNRDQTLALLNSITDPAPPTPAPIHNRATSGTPPGLGAANPTAALAAAVAIEVATGKTKTEALKIIMNRQPDLYKAWLAAGGSAQI